MPSCQWIGLATVNVQKKKAKTHIGFDLDRSIPRKIFLTNDLLLAVYCHEQHGEPVSIRRVRQLRNQIIKESKMDQPLVMGCGKNRFYKPYM